MKARKVYVTGHTFISSMNDGKPPTDMNVRKATTKDTHAARACMNIARQFFEHKVFQKHVILKLAESDTTYEKLDYRDTKRTAIAVYESPALKYMVPIAKVRTMYIPSLSQ